MSPETCPHCGADLPPNANTCPGCGSDEKTGWSEQARYDDLDIPDEDFDYQNFIEREFSGKRRRMHWIWLLVAIGLVLALTICFW